MSSIPENPKLKEELKILQWALTEPLYDSPALVLAGKYMLGEYDRDELPDWVALLAGGDPAKWGEVLDEVREEIRVTYPPTPSLPTPNPSLKGGEREEVNDGD